MFYLLMCHLFKIMLNIIYCYFGIILQMYNVLNHNYFPIFAIIYQQ